MDSIKTAVVVTVLMVVGYAVYQAIHNNLGPAAKKQLTELVTSDPEDAPAEADRTAGSNSPWGRQGTSRTPSSPPRSEARDSRGESSTFARRNARDADRIADGSPDGRGAETPSSAPTFPRLPSRQLREPQRAATTPDRPLATDSPRRTPSEDVAAADFPNARRQAQTAPRPDPAQDSAVQQAGYERANASARPWTTSKNASNRAVPRPASKSSFNSAASTDAPAFPPRNPNSSAASSVNSPAPSSTPASTCSNLPTSSKRAIPSAKSPSAMPSPGSSSPRSTASPSPTPTASNPVANSNSSAAPSTSSSTSTATSWFSLGELYAGRFPIGIGRDQPSLEGQFVVREKSTQRPYYGPDGMIDAGDPRNPLGKYWIGLTEHIGIHGTSDPRSLRRADNRGTICLGQRDIEDLFDILSAESESSAGSRVIVQRVRTDIPELPHTYSRTAAQRPSAAEKSQHLPRF